MNEELETEKRHTKTMEDQYNALKQVSYLLKQTIHYLHKQVRNVFT